MNGVTIQTAKDIYLPRIISYVLQNKKIKGIENAYDFLHSTSDEAKFNEVVKIIKETAKLENISPEEKEAFSWFSEFLDRERVKRIDVDASKLKEEALKKSLLVARIWSNTERPSHNRARISLFRYAT